MQTEITKEILSEYFYPTAGFQRSTDKAVVDYAEIEIKPDGIRKLERNLDRCGNPDEWTAEEWSAITNPDDDAYERIIAYVHFDAGTDNFNQLFIEVVTTYGCEALEVSKLVNEEEKQYLIDAALDSLHKWRGTANILTA